MVTTCTLIRIGSRVRLRDQDGQAEFTIASPLEADVAAGLISEHSPLGQALLGHTTGDRVDVRAPGGLRTVIVEDVD